MTDQTTIQHIALADLYRAIVFDGFKNDPYRQDDAHPLLAYQHALGHAEQNTFNVFPEIAYDLMKYKAENFADDNAAYDKLRAFIAESFADLTDFEINESL